MKRIVVATDFSAESDNALDYILRAIEGHQYEIILFTLQNPSIHALNARVSVDTIDAMLALKGNKLQEIAQTTGSQYSVNVIPYFASGDFFEEISKCINHFDAEMLVMGMAEKSIEQDMLGNTTTSSIHKLKTPILSIPLGATFKGFRHFLFACDVVRGVHKEILERVRLFAMEFGAEVEVFNVRERIQEIADNNEPSIDNALQGITYYYRNVASSEVVSAIRDEVKSSNTDLLIMIPYKYGFWNSLVHRSKTRMMASGSSTPLLSLSI